MKKTACFILILVMLSACVVTVAAKDDSLTTASPDWIITEISPDTNGNESFVGGYNGSQDVFEFIELYNNSGKTLNLYDYAIFYNGSSHSSSAFETQIIEYTPIQGPDWRDGSYAAENWTSTDYKFCGEANLPMNPETCEVAPGEVVVLWSMYPEAVYANWNDGKGMQIEDFRKFWGMPENAKIICWDGNSSIAMAGHDKNFNIKNSGSALYGICLKNENINKAANNNRIIAKRFETYDLIKGWSVLDFAFLNCPAAANCTFEYAIDVMGLGAEELGLYRDMRRSMMVGCYSEASPGRLSVAQKLMMGLELNEGDELFINNIYASQIKDYGAFKGLTIDSKFYGIMDTFSAEADGVYSLEINFENKNVAYPYLTVMTDAEQSEDTSVAENTTVAEDTTTAAPVDTTITPTTEAPVTESGCGGFVTLGIIACLVPAAVVVCKKRD